MTQFYIHTFKIKIRILIHCFQPEDKPSDPLIESTEQKPKITQFFQWLSQVKPYHIYFILRIIFIEF